MVPIGGSIVHITTVAFIVAAILLGMGLANVDSGIKEIMDTLDVVSFDFDVPAPVLAGQATHMFTQTHGSPPFSCEETDTGDDPYTAGSVMATTSEGTQEFSDSCEDDVLLEYYCDGVRLHSYRKPCAYGCWQGVCRNVPAQDPSGSGIVDKQGADRKDMQTVQRVLAPRWVELADTSACKNGFRDGEETDADCGGPCKPCAYSQMCKADADCEPNLVCNYRSKRCLKTKY